MPLAMKNIALGLQYSKGELKILTQAWVLVLFIVDDTKSYVHVNNLKKEGDNCHEPISRTHRMCSKEENSNS